jgi:predicted porin
MQKLTEFSTVCLWLSLCSASVYAQEAAAPVPVGPVAQPALEQPNAPVEVISVPGSTPDQQGTILPGFGFPYSTAAGITGTGIVPFSQGPLVTGTGIIPYAQTVSPSTTLFQVNERFNYSDNVLFLPEGQPTAPNLSRGDFYSVTTGTFSPKINISEQVLFAHATYGINRYRHDSVLNSDFYALDAGANWRLTHLCSGTLLAAQSQQQVPFSEQASPTKQTSKNESINETAKCGIAGHLSAIFDSRWSSYKASSANDYTEKQVRTGLEYGVVKLNNLRAQVTFTNRDFSNRSDVLTPGLASGTHLIEYELYYQRALTPKLNFNGKIGIAQIEVSAPSAGLQPSSSETSGKIYSAALDWKATPKTSFQIMTARGLGPPLAIDADFQVTDIKSMAATYRYSPKLSFNAAVSKSHTINATVSGVDVTPVRSDVKLLSVSLGANYRVSPFINAFLAYSYNDSKDQGMGTTTISNLYMLGLTYSH